MRKRIWEILDLAKEDDRISRVFDLAISSFIFVTVLAVIFETVSSIHTNFAQFFQTFEIIALIVFSIEYFLRLWSCKESPAYAGSWGRLRWALSAFAIIDLLAFLPGIIAFGKIDLRFLRAIRLLRLFRLTRYSKGMKLLLRVFQESKGQIFISLSGLIVLLVIISSILHLVEGPYNPDGFGSIPTAMWWGVATLTTVGYGDAIPVTIAGKICAACIAIIGIGVFALPTAILAGAFAKIQRQNSSETMRICPHCGKLFKDE